MGKITVLFILTAGLAVSLFSGRAQAAETYEVDPVHSAVVFKVKHLDLAYVYGRFNDFSGSVVMDADEPQNSSVSIEVRANSVDTNNKDRDAHLRGPDFFNAKQFPLINFTSTSVKQLKGDRYEVAGQLSLHGKTKSIEIEIVKTGEGPDPWGGHRAGWETTFTIQRSEYGMDYMLDGVSDLIEMTVALEGIRK